MVKTIPLESRLSELERTDGVKDGLISQLESRKYQNASNSANPYYKYNLVSSTKDSLDTYSPTKKGIDNKLNKINKEELKRVYYGLVCMPQPNEEIKKVVDKLYDSEKISFFAGIWKDRKMFDKKQKSVTELVHDYIKEGYDFIHKNHMIKKAKGDYKSTLKLPGSQEYHKNKPQEKQEPPKELIQLEFDF